MKNKFLPILKKELLEIYRSKKLLIIGIIFLFVGVSSPILAKITPLLLKNIPATPGLIINLPDPTWKDAIDQFVKNIAQIVMIVLVFMFAGTITEEKNKKTLEIVLTKPISKANFILAKFFSSIVLVKVATIVSAVIFYLYTVSLFGHFSLLNFVLLTVFLMVYLLLIVAITIFSSVFSSSQIIAAIYSFLFQLVLLTFLGYVKQIKNYLPDYILANYKNLMENGNFKDFLPSFTVSIALIFVLIFASVLIFRRQEIER